jgi:nucleoside-diphosphate kinase
MERTLVLIKPDGVFRHLVGKIITRFEDAGLKIIGLKMVWINEDVAKKHYREDIAAKYGEKVREELLNYIKEGPVIAMALEGADAIKVTRKIVGSTYPNDSPAGTIRGDFVHISKEYGNRKGIMIKNLIHASGNKEDSDIEIPLWFNEKELHSHKTIRDFFM